MSAPAVNNIALNAAATPFDFTPSFETDAPYLVEQHLYDSPANIAHDNQVAVDFLTAHNAPAEFWEQAGYEDPRLSGPRVAPAHPGAVLLLDRMEREREDRIAKLEKRVDLMYVIMNSLNEDFSHFALEHWGPFQAALFRYFGHQCHGAYCTDPPPKSPVVPSPPPGSGRSSPSIPSLESCPSSPDGGEVPEEEDPQESDDSFWSTLSSLRQVTASTNEVEGGSGGSPRPMLQMAFEREVIMNIRYRVNAFDEQCLFNGNLDEDTDAIAHRSHVQLGSLDSVIHLSSYAKKLGKDICLQDFQKILTTFLYLNRILNDKASEISGSRVVPCHVLRVTYDCQETATKKTDLLHVATSWRGSGARYDHAILQGSGRSGLNFCQVCAVFMILVEREWYRLAVVRIYKRNRRNKVTEHIELTAPKDGCFDPIFSSSRPIQW
ncbi:hypothetical protein BJ322DRAFT_1177836 [Thelephora terrestris]|uniref:Uncharacterized protein n=1 Tax=Thelephora terrestris TaxID=56493 RepID=A0A9P6LA86_9AGAM|nr:hypothetical protein BJ322DRAFT_1177836 [Thelephora terrestris]